MKSDEIKKIDRTSTLSSTWHFLTDTGTAAGGGEGEEERESGRCRCNALRTEVATLETRVGQALFGPRS